MTSLGDGGRYWRERAEFWREQAVALGWRDRRDALNGEIVGAGVDEEPCPFCLQRGCNGDCGGAA